MHLSSPSGQVGQPYASSQDWQEWLVYQQHLKHKLFAWAELVQCAFLELLTAGISTGGMLSPVQRSAASQLSCCKSGVSHLEVIFIARVFLR